ncbi:LytTR family DNA-binding domain-containing protein [Spirosoma pulveris]
MKRLTTKRAHYQYDPQQILYLTGRVNYCFVHLTTNEVILACGTLKWFATKWPHFIRVHKTTLINPAYLATFQPAPKASLTSFITMTDQAQLKIARRRLHAVQHAIAQLEAGF